ncbi:MAG TPA: hypothetical protein DCZ94_19015 [Lentisphaeria bacterium]|nr:MAG: hypothetical protein A2X48_08820 [Lentisphaerae bacterium GWF2_49_21]HBC89036.1 hypothetical protein [Lentisphaeria bacterium]
MAGKADPKEMLEMVMKVRSGAMSVTEAAAQLGISRDVYYKWEARALEAMLKAMEGREASGSGVRASCGSPACGERKAEEGERAAPPRDGFAGEGVPVPVGAG